MPKPRKTCRNPVIYAMELRDRMEVEGISRAELARKLGVSRARVTQWLDLLELPEEVIREALVKGDYWNHRHVTERALRQAGRDQGRGTTTSRP